MKLNKVSLTVIGLVASCLTMIVVMGEQSEKYASQTMITTAQSMTEKYAQLHKMFGSVQHFYGALEQAVIKDGYSVTDLLIQNEQVVVDSMSSEYASKVQGLENLVPRMHIHEYNGTKTNYVVGGYTLLGVEAIDGTETIAVFYGAVRKAVVEQMEMALDGNGLVSDNNNEGKLRYNRHESMSNQFVVGIYL